MIEAAQKLPKMIALRLAVPWELRRRMRSDFGWSSALRGGRPLLPQNPARRGRSIMTSYMSFRMGSSNTAEGFMFSGGGRAATCRMLRFGACEGKGRLRIAGPFRQFGSVLVAAPAADTAPALRRIGECAARKSGDGEAGCEDEGDGKLFRHDGVSRC